MGRAGKWIAFSPFLLLTAKRGSVTRFLTLGGEFGFRCLLCGCVIAKGGRGWLAKVLKRECLEKKKKNLKHSSDLLGDQESLPGGPCTGACSRQEGTRYQGPSALLQCFKALRRPLKMPWFIQKQPQIFCLWQEEREEIWLPELTPSSSSQSCPSCMQHALCCQSVRSRGKGRAAEAHNFLVFSLSFSLPFSLSLSFFLSVPFPRWHQNNVLSLSNIHGV